MLYQLSFEEGIDKEQYVRTDFYHSLVSMSDESGVDILTCMSTLNEPLNCAHFNDVICALSIVITIRLTKICSLVEKCSTVLEIAIVK